MKKLKRLRLLSNLSYIGICASAFQLPFGYFAGVCLFTLCMGVSSFQEGFEKAIITLDKLKSEGE